MTLTSLLFVAILWQAAIPLCAIPTTFVSPRRYEPESDEISHDSNNTLQPLQPFMPDTHTLNLDKSQVTFTSHTASNTSTLSPFHSTKPALSQNGLRTERSHLKVNESLATAPDRNSTTATRPLTFTNSKSENSPLDLDQPFATLISHIGANSANFDTTTITHSVVNSTSSRQTSTPSLDIESSELGLVSSIESPTYTRYQDGLETDD